MVYGPLDDLGNSSKSTPIRRKKPEVTEFKTNWDPERFRTQHGYSNIATWTFLKKGKTLWICLISLNSAICSVFNILQSAMLYNACNSSIPYSMLIYQFFAGCRPYRHVFTSAPHAHALNEYTPYRNPWALRKIGAGTDKTCNRAPDGHT